MTTKKLHQDVLKKLMLDELVEVSWSREQNQFITQEGTPERLNFIDVDMLTVGYQAEVKRSDHYLVRNDPWVERQGNPISIFMREKIPQGATHYSLGPQITEEYVSYRKEGNSLDHISIIFLKR